MNNICVKTQQELDSCESDSCHFDPLPTVTKLNAPISLTIARDSNLEVQKASPYTGSKWLISMLSHVFSAQNYASARKTPFFSIHQEVKLCPFPTFSGLLPNTKFSDRQETTDYSRTTQFLRLAATRPFDK